MKYILKAARNLALGEDTLSLLARLRLLVVSLAYTCIRAFEGEAEVSTGQQLGRLVKILYMDCSIIGIIPTYTGIVW